MGRTALLLFLAVFAWIVPPPSDSVYLVWAVRIGAQVGAILTLIHLLCTANDPSLREKLGANPPASDVACPFCGSTLLLLASNSYCPYCGIHRV
jgi:threonine/homoserine/homoserine lactone efflux protein